MDCPTSKLIIDAGQSFVTCLITLMTVYEIIATL